MAGSNNPPTSGDRMLRDNHSILTTKLVALLTSAWKAIFKIAIMAQDGICRAMFGKEKVTSVQRFYDLVDKNMAGEEVSMASFKGQVLLLVNVASH